MMTRASRLLPILGVAALLAGCGSRERDEHEHPQTVSESERRPERYMPADLGQRGDSALLRNTTGAFDTDDAGQPDTLPALPSGTTLDDVREGDRLFHGAGGCVNCHGFEAQGLAGRGSSLTNGLHLIPGDDLRGIDSIVNVGIADAETRSPIAMPPRGQRGDLTPEQTHALAAYVWAVAHARGEPWQGGHVLHRQHDINASARTLIP